MLKLNIMHSLNRDVRAMIWCRWHKRLNSKPDVCKSSASRLTNNWRNSLSLVVTGARQLESTRKHTQLPISNLSPKEPRMSRPLQRLVLSSPARLMATAEFMTKLCKSIINLSICLIEYLQSSVIDWRCSIIKTIFRISTAGNTSAATHWVSKPKLDF